MWVDVLFDSPLTGVCSRAGRSTMIIKANIKEALRSLLTGKQRTILALIGIVIGIASVIGMISIGTIVQHEALRQFEDMGVDILTVRKEFDEKNKAAKFKLSDILELKNYSPIILEVAPYISSGTTFSYGGKTMYIDMMGVTESFFDLNKLNLQGGRFISDLDEHRFFCVIGSEIAQFLRKAGFENPLGQQFASGERIYTIVGILKAISEGGGIRPGNINMSVITHITTAVRVQEGEIESFMARVGPQSPSQIKAEIQNYFSKKAKGLNLKLRTAEELIAQMEKQMQLFTLLLGAIGSISLIVGGIGVMNVMLISVAERRKEIGIRRALGAQRFDIQSQFIMESVVLCLVGGFIGIGLGIVISYVFSYFVKWEFMMSKSAIMLGVGVATAVGVFFGFYPSRSAARLDPIAALRS